VHLKGILDIFVPLGSIMWRSLLMFLHVLQLGLLHAMFGPPHGFDSFRNIVLRAVNISVSMSFFLMVCSKV
jgi:uncharacterized membrane protein (UPF0182 family)